MKTLTPTTVSLTLLSASLCAPMKAFGTGPSLEGLISELQNPPAPIEKIIHVLFYSQPLEMKAGYTIVLISLCAALFVIPHSGVSALILKKIAGYAIPLTLLGLAIALVYSYLCGSNLQSLPAIAMAIVSSFVAYTLDESLDDLLPERDHQEKR